MSIIVIAGRFARDQEARYTKDGKAICNFSIAENVYVKKEKQAQFWECSLFGKQAEALAPYITKGGAATVYGEPVQEKYTGRDGVERTTVKVRVTNIVLQGGGGRQAESEPQPPSREKRHVQPVEDIDDDIPF